MDDIDDLFTDTINDDLDVNLNVDLNGDLSGDLNDGLDVQLDSHLADALNGQLGIPTILAAPAGLIERLDELHASGCNQSVTSKSANRNLRYAAALPGQKWVLLHVLELIEGP